MYDNLRREFLTALHGRIPDELIGEVLGCLDGVAGRYRVETAETALAVPDYRAPAVVDIFLACKAVSGMAEGSIENYRYIFKDFFGTVSKPLDKVTPNDIRMYLYTVKTRREISDRTLDGYRGKLCTFFSWLNDEGYIASNPGKNIEPVKYEAKQRQSLNAVELEKLRRACTEPRDLAIVEFLYSTGCRVSEMLSVKVSDINWRDKTIDVLGKGRKHRTVYLNAKAEIALIEYLDSITYAHVYLFCSSRAPHGQLKPDIVQRRLKAMGEAAGIEKPLSPHIIRHTTATVAARQGMPIQDISVMLGHANVETTMIYAQTSGEQIHAEHLKYVV